MAQIYKVLHARLSAVYSAECCEQIQLAKDDKYDGVKKAFGRAADYVYSKQGFDATSLKETVIKELTSQTYTVLRDTINPHITQEVPAAMRQALETDLYLFSGFKTYTSLKEASNLLLDDNGNVKPEYLFKQDIAKLNATYNQLYLEAERKFAISSAQSAAQWKAYTADGDRYHLQYRTAADSKVRASHQVLQNITLPIDHPFWDSYYPPNGWRCRCKVVQVRKSKYEITDDETAMAAGEKATTELDKNGNNKLAMFRFNPGKQQIIFPENHPYKKLAPAQAVEIIKKQAASENVINVAEIIAGKEVSNKDVKEVLMQYAEKFPDDFRRGLADVKFSSSTRYMMQHSMKYSPVTNDWVGKSTISISGHKFSTIGFNPGLEFKGALAAIKKGEALTFNQEYAVESLWHEILHAKTKSPPSVLRDKKTEAMETLNQFTARHTYPQFLERLGGKAVHQEAILDRGYGYGSWVKTFRENLTEKKIDEKKAVEDLMPALMGNYRLIKDRLEEYLKQE